MGRLQRKKTDSQKLKLKDRQKLRKESSAEVLADQSPSSKKLPDQKKQIQTKAHYSVVKTGINNEPRLIEKVQTFFNEVKSETKKVVWPEKKQTIASTAVVIVLVIIISSFLGLVDVGLKGLISLVLH